jgi:D-alanyl-D-alanine carboxypeptidase/D-alanyl-D-alanine-endopeptidase (penicillin-binding protein 4)
MFPLSLDSLLNVPELAGATVCVTVVDESGALLYDHNGGLRVAPASNEKLFSAAFALWELGADFHPITNFWKQPGQVIVESQGDPSLSNVQLRKVASDLNLDGTLPVLVKEAYAPEIPDGWEIGDLSNSYAAPVAAFSVDQAGVDLWNRGGHVKLEPSAYGIDLGKVGPAVGKGSFHYDPIRRKLTVSGTFPAKDEQIDSLGVPSADGAAASWLGRSFRRVEMVPTDPPSYVVTGPALMHIISECLQHSDNNMAENLLLMGAGHEGALPEDPYPLALKRLKEFESRVVGISEQDVSPRDGSGLTRANLTTTHAVAELLGWSARQPTFEPWRNALARPGVGTLIRRLKGVKFEGKTGSLSNVTALSGYLENMRGKRRIVSVIVNGYSCSSSEANAAIDKFVRFLSENGP